MITLTSRAIADGRRAGRRRERRRSWRWIVAAGVVLLAGSAVRLALGAGGVGDRSAAVMMVLLAVSAWSAAWLLGSPRIAFVVTVALVTLLDLAALPPREMPAYDDRQALYRTDQPVVAQVAVPVTVTSPALTLLIEPIFAGAQPQFGLAAEINGTRLAWDCAFQPGLQRLALPVPTIAQGAATPLDVRLHLTGSPGRESDYLLVYASSVRGGLLLALVGAADVSPDSTVCQLSS